MTRQEDKIKKPLIGDRAQMKKRWPRIKILKALTQIGSSLKGQSVH